jgi:hypothetical protein
MLNLTFDQMVDILVLKGCSQEGAAAMANADLDLNHPETNESRDIECSICRAKLTLREWRYHYHPCE